MHLCFAQFPRRRVNPRAASGGGAGSPRAATVQMAPRLCSTVPEKNLKEVLTLLSLKVSVFWFKENSD